MFTHQPVGVNERIDYLDPALYGSLLTALPPERSATSIQHLVMLCPDMRDLSRLESQSTGGNDRYRSFLLGDWNRWSEDRDGQSLLQRIRP